MDFGLIVANQNKKARIGTLYNITASFAEYLKCQEKVAFRYALWENSSKSQKKSTQNFQARNLVT